MAAQAIEPRDAKNHLDTSDALLVCAYDSDEKFQANKLENTISLSSFESKADSLDKSREIIFY